MATEPVRKSSKDKATPPIKEAKGKQSKKSSTKQVKEINQEKIVPEKSPQSSDKGVLLLGAGLLFFGVLLLVGRFLNFSFGEYLWPFLFITPGVLVFLSALSSDDQHGEGLAILGSILTTLGLVFLGQSLFNLWASWAYIWALVAPTSIGIGQLIYGTHKGRESIRESGKRLINIGLMMFLIGFVFFEIILGLSGFGLNRFGIPVFPMVLIFLGGFILIRSVMRRR